MQYFQLFLSLAVVVASVSAAPRYIVLPIEDVDLSALVGQTLPVYRMPGLMRQARQVEDELDSFQMAPSALRRDSEAAGSNAYQTMWTMELTLEVTGPSGGTLTTQSSSARVADTTNSLSPRLNVPTLNTI